MKKIVELRNAAIQANNGLDKIKTIPDDVNLTIYEHDFLAILSGNDAGESTLFNMITRTLVSTSGSIYILDKDTIYLSTEKRVNYLTRVFQNPKMGTAPCMTVTGNLLITKYHDERRGLLPRGIRTFTDEFQALIARIDNGFEEHSETPTRLLSDGWRQTLSLLVVTLKCPELSLLDKHMAVLDPKTNVSLMSLIDEFITGGHLTALVITHHIEGALRCDNRLIVIKDDKIIEDFSQDEKVQMAVADYYQLSEWENSTLLYKN